MFFLTWGPALLKCYRPRATLIWHWRQIVAKFQGKQSFENDVIFSLYSLDLVFLVFSVFAFSPLVSAFQLFTRKH